MPATGVKTRWVGGDLVFYNGAGVEIFRLGGASASGMSLRRQFRASAEDTAALVAEQSGLVYVGTKASATQIPSLPVPTIAGLEFTFICGDAGGEINIDPGAATYTITGKGITVAATKDLKNTAASNAVGDSVTLVSNGVDGWWITAIQGTWATT